MAESEVAEEVEGKETQEREVEYSGKTSQETKEDEKKEESSEEIKSKDTKGDLEDKVGAYEKKGLEGKAEKAKGKEAYKGLSGKEYSEYSSKSDNTSEEIEGLFRHFLNRIKNAGKAEESNKKIEKGDYTCRELYVLVLGALQMDDDGAEFVKAVKEEGGKDCYVIAIDSSKAVPDIAESVYEKIKELKEKTNATRIKLVGFSLGGSAALYLTQMNQDSDRYISELVCVNTPFSEERTLLRRAVEAIGGIKTRENDIARWEAFGNGLTRVQSRFIFSENDDIIPYGSNMIAASPICNEVAVIKGTHTTIMNEPSGVKIVNWYGFN